LYTYLKSVLLGDKKMKRITKLACTICGGGILMLVGLTPSPVKAELAPGCVKATEYYSPSSSSSGPPNPRKFVVVKNECNRPKRVKAIIGGEGNNSICKSLDPGDIFSHSYPPSRKLIKIIKC
jgi:hypothetical protein